MSLQHPQLPLEIIHRIQQAAQETKEIDRIVLYGSRARGECRDNSDIDLAVKGALSPLQLGTFREKLEKLPVPQKFDLLLHDQVENGALLEKIRQDGVTIYPIFATPFYHHPWPNGFFPPNAARLVLGSTPPPRFCAGKTEKGDVNFFYGSKDNRLWPMLLSDSETPEEFLEKHRTAMADMVLRFARSDENANDDGMLILDTLEVRQLLRAHPTIEQIGCTSQKVFDLLRKEINRFGIEFTGYNETKTRCRFQLDGRWIDVWILPSPSPRNSKKDPREAYKAFLGE
ncbi:MAG: nucleotidyltransferase domain-containing protein [Campylobacterales bacterium]